MLFEYLINGPSACYYSSSGDEKLIIDFSIEIFSPELGYTTQETFISGTNVSTNERKEMLSTAIEFQNSLKKLGYDKIS